MDDFARLPSDERRPYFEQAAAQRGVTAQIIEKDFWVCWGLRRLFSLAEFQDLVGVPDRHFANNLSWLRKITLSLIKQHPGKESYIMKRRMAGRSVDFLM